jgi:hypothetical protein
LHKLKMSKVFFAKSKKMVFNRAVLSMTLKVLRV